MNKDMLKRLEVFAEAGHDENLAWRAPQVATLNRMIPTYEYLSVVLGISLLWTHHAHNNNGFMDYAVPFMESTGPVDQAMVRASMHQHGEDALSITLMNLRALRNMLKKKTVPDFLTCSADDIKAFQTRAVGLISREVYKGTLTGIGTWLTYGPFKIILCLEDRLWNDTGIEPIILSTGAQVDRGVRLLVSNGFIDPYILPFLDEPSQSTIIIHREFQKLAMLVSSSALHINTAAHMLGRGDITI